MTWEQIENGWEQVADKFLAKFDQITDADAAISSGNKNELSAAVQKEYGHTQEEAEAQLEEWKRSLDDTDNIPTSTSGAPTY